MDFFEHQDVARRKTSLLIFYFVVAVILMIVALYLVALGILSVTHGMQHEGDQLVRFLDGGTLAWFQPELLLFVAFALGGIIGLGSVYKTWELRHGGERLAMSLGGRRVQPSTLDPAERRLLNVVEEMAIAAGTAVPPVFVLPNEPSINAFAAGFTPNDAVIGVNRGTIEYLTRDELQGVIAHEFSHILNGDMRLNMRLIGLLHGILVLSIIGYYTFRIMGFSGRSRSSKDKGGGALVLAIVLMGLSAWLVGLIGLFFGRLIKAAISRQREYLADASAVQFTRNPDGLAGALKKIGASPDRSHVQAVEAETASHMFFGSARRVFAAGPFATHPPLQDRILRIDPGFDGVFPRLPPPSPPVPPPSQQEAGPRSPTAGLRPILGDGMWNRWDATVALAAIGTLTAEHVAYADRLLAQIPEVLQKAVREPYAARAVVYAILLAREAPLRQQQLQIVREQHGDTMAAQTDQLDDILRQEGVEIRLPILEVVQSTLQELTRTQYEAFRETVDQLVKADEKLSLLEFMLQRILLDQLDRHFFEQQNTPILYYSVSAIRAEAAALISVLVHAGHKDLDQARRAYAQAIVALELTEDPPPLLTREQCSLAKLRESLQTLRQTISGVNKRVLNAAVVAIAADQQITVTEAELLRAIAAAVNCPMPPLIAGPLRRGAPESAETNGER